MKQKNDLVEDVCKEFRMALSSDAQKPIIASYLGRVPVAAKEQLLQKLVELEFEILGSVVAMERASQLRRDIAEYAGLIDSIAMEQKKLDETWEGDEELGDANIPSNKVIVGNYQVGQQIGEGGMGSVYVAEQLQPVKRNVALKVIKTGRNSKQVIARFDAERQALAKMDHPCIARIIDAGETQLGQPYFAMELVNGVPLTVYCDNKMLSIGDRLKLFKQICEGVQHAHQKGVLHRDLKPANILVTEYDGKPVPKIIDFGLAKALESSEQLTDKTIHTELGQVLGTVKYMSPEQAGLDSLDVDTRSDIYALGIILYELLTGTTPLDNDSIHNNAILKVLELVREQVPVRPSDKLSRESHRLSKITSRRKTEPRRLTSILSGELDWIVMKALEKDRERRYSSASEFADDVRRFLNDEPVDARPPSMQYRLKKFASKNRGLVASIGTIAFLLIAGVAGTSYGLVQANHNADIAELNAEKERKAKVEAINQKKIAEQKTVEVQIESERTKNVLEIVTTSFASTSHEQGAKYDMPARDVLFNAKNNTKASKLDDLGKAKLYNSLATSFLSLSEYADALTTSKDAYELYQTSLGPGASDTLHSAQNLSQAYQMLGKLDEAIELLEQITKIHNKAFGPKHINSLIGMNNLGAAYLDGGKTGDAIRVLEQTHASMASSLGDTHIKTLICLNDLARAYDTNGQIDKAVQMFQRIFNIRKATLGEEHPDTLTSGSDLALAFTDIGRFDDSINLYNKLVRYSTEIQGKDHLGTMTLESNLAGVYKRVGRLDEAHKLHARVHERAKNKLGADHPFTLATTTTLAKMHLDLGEFDKAMPLYIEVLKKREQQLGEDHPDTLQGMHNLAFALSKVNQFDDAIELFEQTIEKRKSKLGLKHPKTLNSMNSLGHAFSKFGKMEKAVSIYEKTLKLRIEVLGHEHPSTLSSMNNLAFAFEKTGRLDEAIKLYEQAFQVRLSKLGFEIPDTRNSMYNLADAYDKNNQLLKAIELYEKLVEVVENDQSPDESFLHLVRGKLAWLAMRVDDYQKSEENLLRIREYETKNKIFTELSANNQLLLGTSLLGGKKYQKALVALEAGYNLYREQVENPPTPNQKNVLLNAVSQLMMAANELKDEQEKKKWEAELEKIKTD